MPVELLSPAGNLEKLKIALAYGADAVYGGVSHFSLRNRSGKEFDYDSFQAGMDHVHALGKKIYVTINGFPFNSQLKLYWNHIEKMAAMNPDAFIVSTPGVIRMAKEIAPQIPLHLSTQANVMNVYDAAIYAELGIERIIAAREISLKDLVAIKKELPDLEIEIFIHGSMCFAFSGRCLISAVQTGRVPNRGSCANDCRFEYEMYAESPEAGVLLRMEENEEGTHIFNAKDLNLSAHIKEILDSGAIDSLKIEGRTKSDYYAGITARTYRKAIDDYYAGQFDAGLYEQELNTTKHRGFSDGYIVSRPHEKNDTQNFETSISEGTHQVIGLVEESGDCFMCKYATYPGEESEIIIPPGYLIEPVENEIGKIYQKEDAWILQLAKIETKHGKILDSVHSGNENPIKLPAPLPPLTFLRRRTQ